MKHVNKYYSSIYFNPQLLKISFCFLINLFQINAPVLYQLKTLQKLWLWNIGIELCLPFNVHYRLMNT